MKDKLITVNQLKNLSNFSLGYGHFKTIHPGHIRYLKYAKSLSAKLVIALKGDGIVDNKESLPYEFSQKERAEALLMLDIADAILLLKNEELSEVIKVVNPNYLVLGKQFESNPEIEVSNSINILSSRGVPIVFHGGEISYSNTELLNNSDSTVLKRKKEEFNSACNRLSLTKEKLRKSILSWKNANLIVIGDTIVDRYVACEALGMSAEAPIVVVKELKKKDFCGGAGIVATHIRNLGARCKLISVIGNDKNGEFVKKRIREENLGDGLIIDNTRPTTFKKRYIVENQKLFRVTRLEQCELNKNIEEKVIKELEKSAINANGIVISDFVYGVITPKILKKIIELAKKYKLHLFGDLQCSSQIGSIMKFKDFSLLCPNEREARVALHEKDLDLEALSIKIIKETNADKLIMKLGSDGFIAYEKKDYKLKSQSFPALCVNPVDVAGAGDSLLAVMAVGISSSQGTMKTAAIACCMTSLAVRRMGNKPIKSEELTSYINEIIP